MSSDHNQDKDNLLAKKGPDYLNMDKIGQLKSVNYLSLMKYADSTTKWMSLAACIMSIGQGVTFVFVVYVFGSGLVVVLSDHSIPAGKVMSETLNIFYMALGAALGCLASGIGSMFLFKLVGRRMTKIMQARFLESVLNQDTAWFDEFSPEKITTMFNDNIATYIGSIGDENCGAMIGLGCVVGAVIICLWKSILYSAVIMPFGLMIAFANWLLGWALEGAYTYSSEKYIIAGGFAEEAISGIKTVKSLNGEKHEEEKYGEQVHDACEKIKKYGFWAAFAIALYFAATAWFYGVGFAVAKVYIEEGFTNYNTGELFTIKDLIICIFVVLYALMFTGKSIASWVSIKSGQQAAATLFAVIEQKPSFLQNDLSKKCPNRIKGDIKFQNVNFNYHTRPNVRVLGGIDIEIKAGQKVALVGETGCGKSTVISLIERFYDPTQGRVLIDDEPIRKYNLQELRKHIGFVGQEPVLFSMSIKENMMIGNTNVTDSQLKAALIKANAWEFIEKLENGLDTYAGAGGCQLSGGQKQRLAIARAMLSDPAILLLDESTSSLDRKNEREIQKTLDDFSQNRTTVIVAHRLSSIKNCDVIFCLKDGKVVERGTHDELMTIDEGVYANLVQKQSGLKGLEEPDNVDGAQGSGQDDNQQDSTAVDGKDGEKSQEAGAQATEETPFCIPYGELWEMVGDKKVHTVIGFVCCLLNGVIGPLEGLLLSYAVQGLDIMRTGMDTHDEFVQYAGGELTNTMVWSFVGMGFAFFAFYTMGVYFLNLASEQVTEKIRLRLYRKYLSVDMQYHDQEDNTPAKLNERLTEDTKNINVLCTKIIGGHCQTVGGLACGFITGMAYCWQMALMTIPLVPLYVLVNFSNGIIEAATQEEVAEGKADCSAIVQENVNNIKTVRSSCTNGQVMHRFRKVSETEHVNIKTTLLGAFLMSTIVSLEFFLLSIAFILSAVFEEYLGLSRIDVTIAMLSLLYSSWSMASGATYSGDFATAKGACERIWKALDERNEIVSTGNKSGLNSANGTVEFKNVWFKYPTRSNYILKDISFKIDNAQKVGIAGSSGNGKSTIMQLLLRFYDVTQGNILINGINIQEYSLNELRSMYGWVQQEPFLFNETIEYNIRYNKYGTQMSEIRDAAKNSHAIKFIEHDEQLGDEDDDQALGFQRNVGVKGSKLSGGQKQRVAIARAILRKPSIYLFDEATSALDTESEKIVQDALDQVGKENTCISIAHRISTIRDCTNILVLDKGVIAEQGTFDELMNKKGIFWKLNSETSS
jgi:ATP-binding cassette subfamily B (MDR/TAP) protein 1